jgi:YgiT-type zinc finger domain-containing protein
MKCVMCKQGDTAPGFVTVSLQRGNTTVVQKGVPAEVCSNCGEYYVSQETTNRLLEKASRAAREHTEIEIVQFAA